MYVVYSIAVRFRMGRQGETYLLPIGNLVAIITSCKHFKLLQGTPGKGFLEKVSSKNLLKLSVFFSVGN